MGGRFYKFNVIILIFQSTLALPQKAHQKGTRPFNCLRITYNIVDYTEDLPREQVDIAIQKACDVWANVTPLTFTRIRSDNANVVISFKFFKKSTKLYRALSYYTLRPQPKIVFNDFYCWTVGRHWGKNLFQVAVNEFGALLGLESSSDSSSVMYNIYQGYNPNLALSEGDIQAIQAIYGKGVIKKEAIDQHGHNKSNKLRADSARNIVNQDEDYEEDYSGVYE